jgi:hypothetical protein
MRLGTCNAIGQVGFIGLKTDLNAIETGFLQFPSPRRGKTESAGNQIRVKARRMSAPYKFSELWPLKRFTSREAHVQYPEFCRFPKHASPVASRQFISTGMGDGV